MDLAAREQSTSLLNRLSQKPDVQRTLILARESGAIIEALGYQDVDDEVDNGPEDTRQTNDDGIAARHNNRSRDASLVFQHVKATRDLILALGEEKDGDDDLRLLRLRTKRHEFMIVPDERYIAVVIRAIDTT